MEANQETTATHQHQREGGPPEGREVKVWGFGNLPMKGEGEKVKSAPGDWPTQSRNNGGVTVGSVLGLKVPVNHPRGEIERPLG